MRRSWLRLPALAAGTALLLVGPAMHGMALDPSAAPGAALDPRAPNAAPVLAPVPVGGVVAVAAPEVSSPPGSSEPDGAPLDRRAVTAALRPLLSGGALGPGRSPAHVIDLSTGAVLYNASNEPTVPASTMKLITATSVLEALGPDQKLRTRAVLVAGDAKVPRVVVIGAGDPSLLSAAVQDGRAAGSLAPASIEQLADATTRALALRGITRVKVGYDASLFTGPAVHRSWGSSFPAEGIVAPVSALQVDQGRRTPGSLARWPDPAAAAGQAFARSLTAAGVRVRGVPLDVLAPADSATLAAVESPSVGVLVEQMLATSDNDFAEALGRLGAAASGQRASFVGVSRRASALLAQLQVPATGARFADASGLSRLNRLEPSTLTDLLRVTATGYGSLHSGLPVAGATGSLQERFRAPEQEPARGVVRAKTGTLTSVVGLAGYASRPDGRLLAFAFLDDSAPGGTTATRAALDRAAAALVSCDCAAPEDPGPTASAVP